MNGLSARFASVLMMSCLAGPGIADQPLEEAMTAEEFRLAGLYRLTPQELLALNSWLDRESGTDEKDHFGEEQLPANIPDSGEEEISSSIDGLFEGWSGRTIFRLANGQVWQQRLPGNYRYKAVAPEVILKRGRFGYYLKLVASDRQIAVKRLK